MRAAALLCLLALACASGGCILYHGTVGGPLPERAAELVPGTTTKAEALALLGAPRSIRRQFDGDLLTWARREERSKTLQIIPRFELYQWTRGSSRQDLLTLLFDPQGVLRGVGLAQEIPVQGD